MACKVATQKLDGIATTFQLDANNLEPLIAPCMTTLSSKM